LKEVNALAEQMKGYMENPVALVGGSASGKGSVSDSAMLQAMIPGKGAGNRAKIAPQIPKAGKAVKKIVAHKAKEVSPQQVIPPDDADFQDF